MGNDHNISNVWSCTVTKTPRKPGKLLILILGIELRVVDPGPTRHICKQQTVRFGALAHRFHLTSWTSVSTMSVLPAPVR